MRPIQTSSLRGDQRGQLFGGYLVAIFMIAALVVFAANSIRRTRSDAQSRIYREQALNVARAGFEDGLSYFRRQPDGVYLDAYPNDAPTGQAWVTPWPQWPDAAFLPQPGDTDHYALITASSPLTTTAGGIVRTVPLNSYSNTPTSVERQNSQLWGRYVLRRQNQRNWSPGANTFAARTDPEAVHDLTHIRSDAKPGSGNYWSIFSRGYVFAYPNSLTIPAAHEGNSLLSAPRRFYNGKRLLMSTASVYGELFRINFNQPNAAAFVRRGNQATLNVNGVINGQGSPAVARTDNTNVVPGGALNGGYTSVPVPPSVAYCFPGLDKARLKDMASSINPDKVGGLGVFPYLSKTSFADDVSDTSFYYVPNSALAPSGTLTFARNGQYVLSGVGLVFVDGNLVIEDKNQSAWAGVVFVDGNVSIRGPAEISGTLIATGTITVGNSADINKAFVEYNADAIAIVQSFLQNFRVLTNSVVASPY